MEVTELYAIVIDNLMSQKLHQLHTKNLNYYLIMCLLNGERVDLYDFILI